MGLSLCIHIELLGVILMFILSIQKANDSLRSEFELEIKDIWQCMLREIKMNAGKHCLEVRVCAFFRFYNYGL